MAIIHVIIGSFSEDFSEERKQRKMSLWTNCILYTGPFDKEGGGELHAVGLDVYKVHSNLSK